MRRALSLTAFVAVLAAVSVLLAGIAATLALARAGPDVLATDLSSKISADYSANENAWIFAPVSDRITEDARRDDRRLNEVDSDVEIVDVHHNRPPAGNNVAGGEPGPTPAAGATPRPGAHTPTPVGQTPAPGQNPTPTVKPTATPGPGETPKPTPAPTPSPTQSPTPTPTPPPFPANWTLYLHNNPTPPIGQTNSQTNLLLNLNAPTASALFNYDADRDNTPGLCIQRGGIGGTETDPLKTQAWATPAFATSLTIQGSVKVALWSAMKNFSKNKRGAVTVYLNDVSATSVPIALSIINDASWQQGSGSWVQKTFIMPVPSYTLPAGHRLEFKVTVSSVADDDMWFAYDTVQYPSLIQLN